MENILRTYREGQQVSITTEELEELKHSWMPSKFTKALIRVENMKRKTLGNVGLTCNRVQVGSSRMEIEYLIETLEMELTTLRD